MREIQPACLFVFSKVESHFELNFSWTQTNSWLGLFVELSYHQYRIWCLVLLFHDISFIYQSSLLLCDFWWIPIEIWSCLVFGNHPGSCFKYIYFWLLRYKVVLWYSAALKQIGFGGQCILMWKVCPDTYRWLGTQCTNKNLSFSDAVWLTTLFLMGKCVWYSFATHRASQKQWRMSTEVPVSLDQSV